MSKPKKSVSRKTRKKTKGRSGPSLMSFVFSRLALILLTAMVGYVVYLDIAVRNKFEGTRWPLPAHVYTRPLEVYADLRLSPAQLMTELDGLGYRQSAAVSAPGTYIRSGSRVTVFARPFTFWDGPRDAIRFSVDFTGERVRRLELGSGSVLDLVRLEPQLAGSILPDQHEDRSLVDLETVPDTLIAGLLAVEDRNFYRHIGIDPRGIARAMWANVTAGRWVQGGSTLTQQLIKNFYLTSERTISRKLQEMIMALLLELHYDKDEILEAYLNEVYLGQTGNRAIHGFGLGSLFYFGRPLKELQLPELALLVGLIKGPSYYNPRVHPKRALQRRELVLTEMVEVNAVTEAEVRRARDLPLGITARGSMTASAYPAYLDFVRRQLSQDYREEDLRSEGLRIFTTLDPYLQRGVERAVTQRLATLERGRAMPSGTLEAAAVVVRSDSGEILALVGGRHARLAGFNRAADALRPIGSLIKPVVYLTALEDPSRYTLATLLDDAPLRVQQRGSPDWVPTNYDQQFHGRVLLIDALAHSYNVSTARLGMQLGVSRVIETFHRLGARREIPSFPSVLLGATSVSPVEVAQIYLTLANNGFRVPLRSIRSVLTQGQDPLARYPLSIEQVIEPAPMALLHFALQEVVRRGTARGLVQRFPAELELAGKTGTTDDFRDSWFAGYSGDYMAVVWVGRDDNTPTGLTGASGAMQVWADIMQQLDLHPLIAPRPDDLQEALIDRQSGGYADGACGDTMRLPFVAGSIPAPASCARTVSKRSDPVRKQNNIGGWFKRLFKNFNE